MTYLDERKRPPPFLELSKSTMTMLQRQKQSGQETAIDLDSVMTLWTTLANSSEYVCNGRRLENMSWRVVNKSLLNRSKFNRAELDTLIRISTDQNVIKPKPSLFSVPSRPSTYQIESKETTHEVSDSDFEQPKRYDGDKLTQHNLERQQSTIKMRKGVFFLNNSPSSDSSSSRKESVQLKSQVHKAQNDSKVRESSPLVDQVQADDKTKLLYEKLKRSSPQSDTQKSQTSLFAVPNPPHQKITFSDDDDDLDDSDWSSLSDDSEFEADDDHILQHEEALDFQKKQLARPQLHSKPSEDDSSAVQLSSRKSLLSGLFVDNTAAALKPPINQHRRLQRQETEDKHRHGSPKLVYSNGFTDHLSVRPLDDDAQQGTTAPTASSMTTIKTAVPKFLPQENPRDLLIRHTSNGAGASGKDAPPTSTKSGISLASFFSNNRKPSHSHADDQYDQHHQSNAPPTATTLLPTALATHMFLPTMSLQQQAMARRRDNQMRLARHHRDSNVSATSEADSEYSSSIRTSTSSIDIPGSMKRRVHLENQAAAAAAAATTTGTAGTGKSPVIPPPAPKFERANTHTGAFDRPESVRLSPKSTRLQMLSKELPLKLMDSINNENKLFYNRQDARLKGVSNDTPDSDLDKAGHEEKSGGESLVDDDSSVDQSSRSVDGSNIIADGIMGNKLRLVRSKSSAAKHGSAVNGLMFNDDGYVDDRLVALKARTQANLSKPESVGSAGDGWDDDNLNYHARGW